MQQRHAKGADRDLDADNRCADESGEGRNHGKDRGIADEQMDRLAGFALDHAPFGAGLNKILLTRAIRFIRRPQQSQISRSNGSARAFVQRLRASSSIIPAAFSAIIIVGELVLPDVIVGMIEASTTRNPRYRYAQPFVHHRQRIVLRPIFACRPDGRWWCRCRRLRASAPRRLRCAPCPADTRPDHISQGRRATMRRSAHGIRGDAAVLIGRRDNSAGSAACRRDRSSAAG